VLVEREAGEGQLVLQVLVLVGEGVQQVREVHDWEVREVLLEVLEVL
jgi:hypothetical protein